MAKEIEFRLRRILPAAEVKQRKAKANAARRKTAKARKV